MLEPDFQGLSRVGPQMAAEPHGIPDYAGSSIFSRPDGHPSQVTWSLSLNPIMGSNESIYTGFARSDL